MREKCDFCNKEKEVKKIKVKSEVYGGIYIACTLCETCANREGK